MPGSSHRFLSCVDPLMVEEGRALAEGAATVRAHEGLLARVDASVAEQHCALGESLPAVPAAEGAARRCAAADAE